MALNKNCARINSPALENEPNKYASCYNPVLNTFIVREAVLSPSSQESKSERHVSGRCQVHRVAARPRPFLRPDRKGEVGRGVGKGGVSSLGNRVSPGAARKREVCRLL